jgi:hypothetical protein
MANLLGLLADGWREIGRLAQRFGLRRRLAAADQSRRQALTRLGQTAWQSKLDLAEFAQLRGQLEQLDARAGDLSATTARLDAERAELQARRQAEATRFDALLAPARAAQSQADTALQAARAALSQQASADAAAKAALTADVDARTTESRRCAAETARLEAERKAVLQPLDAGLDKLRQASAAATQDGAAVGRDQDARFLELGAAFYERRAADPALAECMQAVTTVDAERAAVQAQIDASLAQTGAMPSGTMGRFAAVVLLVPVLLVVAGYVAYGRLESPGPVVSREARATSAATAPPAARFAAPRIQVAADEKRKDDAVQAYLNARSDANLRKAGIEILRSDVLLLGSAADRSSLPLLLTVLERGEPELRAAAANAVGMIGPTAADTPVLVNAFNDPMPAVRQAMLPVLERMQDLSARLLAQRVRAAARDGEQPKLSAFEPTVVPDAAHLGTPIYPGATFLVFASDLEIGRVSFSSSDPVQKVVDHYAAAAAAGRPPVNAEEFTGLYFGGTASDPTSSNAASEELQAWFQQAAVSGRPEAEVQAEIGRRVRQMLSRPGIRYADGNLYGEPVFIATAVTAAADKTQVVRYVVVFQDHSLGRTGFEYHTAAVVTRK